MQVENNSLCFNNSFNYFLFHFPLVYNIKDAEKITKNDKKYEIKKINYQNKTSNNLSP